MVSMFCLAYCLFITKELSQNVDADTWLKKNNLLTQLFNITINNSLVVAVAVVVIICNQDHNITSHTHPSLYEDSCMMMIIIISIKKNLMYQHLFVLLFEAIYWKEDSIIASSPSL